MNELLDQSRSNQKIPPRGENDGKSDLVDEPYKEEDLLELENFMAEEDDDEDEEMKLQRAAADRKKRREEILQKHSSNSLVGQGLAVKDGDSGAQSKGKVVDITVGDSKDRFDEAKQLAAEKEAFEIEEKKSKSSITFDIFSASPSDLGPGGGGGGAKLHASSIGEEEDPHLQSNWDDGEGYYKTRIGEVILDRFRTLGVVGKGVFSTVLKCQDLRPMPALSKAALEASASQEDVQVVVAIKFIRNNETMRKAAAKERQILTVLAEHDPQNKKHCVRLLDTFEYRNHVAFVFDFHQMNLRETLKKFGKDVGISIEGVRLYARQLFVALKHLADLRIVHADIKLDNILCSADLKQVRLCDFGSAFFETDPENVPTPYLVSRFYRAPEIILGLPYDRAIDLWSVAVSLFELFTGRLMFPGHTNNEMLRLQMNVKGRFANKQIKAHLRQYEMLSKDPHLESDMRFKQFDVDPVTGKPVMRLVDVGLPTRDLSAIIRSSKAGADDSRLVSSFAHLLDQCLMLDPARRSSAPEALKHPFFTKEK